MLDLWKRFLKALKPAEPVRFEPPRIEPKPARVVQFSPQTIPPEQLRGSRTESSMMCTAFGSPSVVNLDEWLRELKPGGIVRRA